MDIQKMMQQAQQVQNKLEEMQEKFKDIDVQGESGGGLVNVTMSCAGVVRSIQIADHLVDPSDKETLEDLIVAAVNNANEAKDAKIQSETQAMMKEMGLPAGAAGGGMPF